MTRKIIDMTKDPRGGQFEYFRTMTDPWAGITVPVDITALLASLNGRPFFLSYLYAVMRAANAVPELRRRLLPDGQVVEYDHCDPSYTVMKPDGTGVYVYCLLEDDLSSYEKFVAEGKRRQKETLERGTLTEDGDVLANFFISCVPWLYYTQIKEPAGVHGFEHDLHCAENDGTEDDIDIAGAGTVHSDSPFIIQTKAVYAIFCPKARDA